MSTHERNYLSWSEVNQWLFCQQAWQWHYREHLRDPSPAGIYLQMGSAAHGLLQLHYGTYPLSRTWKRLQVAKDNEYARLDMSHDEKRELRQGQLDGYAEMIWSTWGKDKYVPAMVTEMPLKVPVPWDEKRGFLCIPDAFHVDYKESSAILMSHKTSLSSLPDLHRLMFFHQQARMEAWALRRAFGVKEVQIFFNVLTPKKAERSDALLYGDNEDAITTEELEHMFMQVGNVPIVSRTGNHCFQCQYYRLHSDLALGLNPDEVKKPYQKLTP